MKHLKHLFTTLLLLCCVGTATAHDFSVSGIYYNITDATNKTVEVTYRGYYYYDYSNEYTGNVVIPESVTYDETIYSVTSIGSSAFRDCTELTSVTIPNSVTSIGNYAFRVCSRLTSITIPNSVTSIGDYAFYDCTGLISITIPNSVTSIGYQAFYNCSELNEVHISNLSAWCNISFGSSNANPLYYAKNLYLNDELITELTIPNSVRNIRNYAFYNCSGLTSIEIPNSITSIGESAFRGCSRLTSIIIPNSVTSIDYGAFYNCSGLTSIIVDDNNTKYDSRENCNAIIETETNTLVLGCENTIIPNSVTSIGSFAFSGCDGLTSITIPSSVTSIEDYAFYECTGLRTVYNFSNLTFSKGSSSNGYVAYYADKAYNAPNGFIDGDFIWYENEDGMTLAGYLGNATELALPDDYNGKSVTSIGSDAFRGCYRLTSIEIPNSVTSIGSFAFRDCSGLKEVHISDLSAWCGIDFSNDYANLLYYAHNLYLNGELVTDLVIPDGVTEIKDYAFYGCRSLTSAEIPNSITSIGVDAFRNCSGLTSVEIPNSVTSIGVDAFRNCSGLKKVINFSSLTFSKGYNDYGYVADYADTVINAPNGSVEGDFVFGVIDGVNTLCGYIGAGGDVTLPADYKGENYAIGADVFKNNTSLTSVEIPNSVTSIGEEAFCGCSGLKEVHISDLSAWCNIAFASADANPLYYAGNLYLNGALLTELSIPAEIAEVKDYAFYNCNGVTNIDIVDGVKSIGNSAFYGCDDLETLYISNTIESIGDYAFAECNNILDIKIGSKKAITASENIFSSDAYNNACLYVPTSHKDFYAKTSPWSNFIIREMDFTGIEDVEAEGKRVKDVYYDLSGRVVENPSSGIYIINGKKVIIK